MSRKISLCLALALSSAACADAAAQTLPPWAEWSTEPLPHPSVANTYAALRAESPVDSTQGAESLIFANWKTSQLDGYWKFDGNDANQPPTRYFRYRIIENDPWRIAVSWACDEPEQACIAFQAAIPGLLPPPPPPPPPDHRSNAYFYDDDPILTERCKHKSPAVHATYPRELRGTGIKGVVVVQVMLNPCGEVRQVRLSRSSGNAILDSSAMSAARNWVFAQNRVRLSAGRGTVVSIPVDLSE